MLIMFTLAKPKATHQKWGYFWLFHPSFISACFKLHHYKLKELDNGSTWHHG
jgi:hypothetical protein